MEKSHWYELAKHLLRSGYINNGLTIPYLYGAYLRLGYELHSIEDLLNLILSQTSPFVPVIERCDVIHHDVLQLETIKQIKKNRSDQHQVSVDGDKNFLVISYNTNLGNTVKKVANALSGLYQKQIDDGDYSWNNKTKAWQPFTDYDKEAIAHIR